jgi:hypothetical protein
MRTLQFALSEVHPTSSYNRTTTTAVVAWEQSLTRLWSQEVQITIRDVEDTPDELVRLDDYYDYDDADKLHLGRRIEIA